MAAILLCACLCFAVSAEDASMVDPESILPPQLLELLDNQQESMELLEEGSVTPLLQKAAQLLRKAADKPLSILGKTLAILLLAALVRAFSPSGELSVAPQVDTVVTVTVFFLVCTPLLSLLDELSQVVSECRNFLIAYIPAFSALLTAGGQPAAGAVFSGFFLSGAVLCAQFICAVLLPLSRIFLALCITSGISSQLDLSGVCDLVLRLVKKMLAICAGAFSAVMCLQKITAGAADTLVQKAGRMVVGSAVPVIGRAVSDAMTTVYASMDVIKGTVGIAGICAMAALFLPVLFKCLLYYAVLWLASAAAKLTDNRHCAATFAGFASCVELYAAILIFFSVIIVVSTALMLSIGG